MMLQPAVTLVGPQSQLGPESHMTLHPAVALVGLQSQLGLESHVILHPAVVWWDPSPNWE